MPADPKRVQEIFLAAVAQPDRAAVLDRECGADVVLRKRVEALLRAHDAPGSLPEGAGTEDLPPPPAPADAVGTVVAGRYKLLQQIGEGGMGAVYMAEQTQPVKRLVALKVVKAGLDSRTVLARFEAERQALALMSHPNIAQVLDAGTTEAGQPFFVMELVKGVPLTQFCDDRNLSVADRLLIFQQVCQAVQHAHQKGIIHRDLKPGNILVESHDGKPVPKVIDFGLAKAMNALPLTERSLFTHFGAVLGTPLYMAPEQAELSAIDVDTRVDIYALGVILYELLTGTTPLEKKRLQLAAWDEIRRVIKEEEPPKPSTRLSSSEGRASIAARRQSEPGKLGRFVRGDLDWIAMKALAKERDRRYQTANALAADVERFLNYEPVSAGPPTVRYKVRKFVRRNRGAVLAAGLVLLALLAGVVGTTWGLVEARQQRDVAEEEKKRAEDEAAISRAVNEFLQKDLLGQADIRNQPMPGGAAGRNRDITVRELLDRASKGIEGKFADQPLTEAAIRLTLGTTYMWLGRLAESQTHLERSVQLRTGKLGPDHPETLSSKHALAELFIVQDNLNRGKSVLREVIAARTTKLGADHPDTLSSKSLLAGLYHAQVKLDRAEILYKEVIAAQTAKLGADHVDTLYCKLGLAAVYMEQGNNDQAEPLLNEGVRCLTAKLGADHPDTLNVKLSLVWLYANRGEYDRAEILGKEALDGLTAKLGADNPNYTSAARTYLAQIYLIQRKYNQAESLLDEELAVAKWGPAHHNTLWAKKDLARVYRAQGKHDRAEMLFKEVIGVAIAKQPYITMDARHGLAVLYRHQGKYDQAEPLLKQVLDARVAELGADHPFTLISKNDLAILYRDQGKYDRAEPLHREVADGARKKLGLAHPHTQTYNREWSVCYERMGQPARGEPLMRELVDVGKKKAADSPPFAEALAALGANLLLQQKAVEAEPLLRQALAIRDKQQPEEWETSHIRSLLGGALLGRKKYAEAEPLLVQGYEGMKRRAARIPAGDRVRLAEAAERLVQFYEATGHEEEAAEWRKKREVIKTGKPAPNL